MGLFGGKKKTYRDFSYTRMIEDEYLPDVMGQAVTTYVLDENNTKSLADLMIEYGWKSNNVKWNAAYRWASRNNNYGFGLPKASVVNETDFTGAESLDTVLKSLTGSTRLDYIYSNFGPINLRHAMWQLLISNYGYTPTDNILRTLSDTYGSTVYLYDAINYLQTVTQQEAVDYVLNHWGYPPKGGATQNRNKDLSRPDTPNATSTSQSDYIRVEYTFRASGLKHITTTTTTKVDTLTRTPNSSGGYDDETTTNSSDSVDEKDDWGSQIFPPDGNIISRTATTTQTDTKNESDPPVVETKTDPTTGVITQTTTTVSRVIKTDSKYEDIIAFLTMGFGDYAFNPDKNVDTTTVLDDRDKGNVDPNAVFKPSGEGTATDDDYFQVLFNYINGEGKQITSYFTYQYGSGSYPDLDGISSTEVKDFGKDFPRLHFRLNGDTITVPRVGQHNFDSLKNFARKLDMDWAEVEKEIYKSLSSLGKIRDVFMIQCVPANTKDPIEAEYLFRYFKTLYNFRPATDTSNYGIPPSNPEDRDSFDWAFHNGGFVTSSDTRTTMNHSSQFIGYKQITGNIGPVGKAKSGYTTRRIMRPKNPGVQGTSYSLVSTPCHYYQLQINATTYQEVRVYALNHEVKVGGKFVGKSKQDENLMIPLDYAFRNMFSPHERETLYARATHLIICTEYTVKSKWYQTGIFKAVVVVVAVALSWWTGGASLSLIGAVTAVATAIGTAVILSLLSKYVFSKLGGVFAVLATVVAIAVALYTGYVYFAGTAGPFSLTAPQMMQASNVAFKAAQSAQQGVIAEEMKKISNLQDEMEQKSKELEAANAELEGKSNSFDNSIFMGNMQGYTYMGEHPEQYFARTLNTNIGSLALELPNIYLAQGLSLPSDVAIMQGIQQNIDKPFELLVGLENNL